MTKSNINAENKATFTNNELRIMCDLVKTYLLMPKLARFIEMDNVNNLKPFILKLLIQSRIYFFKKLSVVSNLTSSFATLDITRRTALVIE